MQINMNELNRGLYRDENKFTLGEWIMIIYTFVISTNLINQFFLLSTLLFVVAALHYALNIKLNKSIIVIFMFAIAYMIGCMIGGSVLITTLMRPFYFVLFFILGKIVSNDGNRKLCVYLIFAMAFGAAAHGIANFIMNYMEYGMNPHTRNLPDIWTGKALSATGQGALFAPFLGTLFYGFFCTKKLLKKLVFVAVLVCMCMYNMMTASRAVFVILAITLVVCLIVYMVKRGGDARLFIWFMAIVIVLTVVYMTNMFGVKDFIEDTAFTKRIDSMEESLFQSGRSDHMWHYITHLYKSPFGGRFIKADYLSSAHNLFLDIYDVAGFLGMFFSLWFCIIIFKKTLKFLKIKWVDLPFKILTFGMILSMFLQMMIEPVLEGMPWLFAMFCMASGIIEGVCDYAEEQQKKALLR